MPMDIFTINNSDRPAIGIDLGGTKTESVLLAPDGTVLFRQRRPTLREDGYNAVLGTMAEMIREAADQLSENSTYTIGIGIPGSIDSTSGLVRNANSTCLIGQPLQKDIEHLIGRTVRIRNDADCFTLAEYHSGAAQGYGLVFGVIIGTGCGGGLCIDGVVREGPHRIAGEWGHMVVDPNGARCYCGKRGCIETLISGSGVEAAHFNKFGQKLTMDEIVARARLGEQQCRETFDHFLDNFGRSLGGLISILDPDAIVLGGGDRKSVV